MPKLARATIQVLKVLDDQPEAFGLQIMDLTGLLSGTVYPILNRLERAGWAIRRIQELQYEHVGRRTRRYYALTDQGRTMFHEYAETHPDRIALVQ